MIIHNTTFLSLFSHHLQPLHPVLRCWKNVECGQGTAHPVPTSQERSRTAVSPKQRRGDWRVVQRQWENCLSHAHQLSLVLSSYSAKTNKQVLFIYYVLNFITNYSARRNSCQHTAAVSLNDNSTSYFFTITTSNIPISSLSSKSSFYVSVL